MPKETDYKAMWNHLKDQMTYLTQQGVTSLHPIVVMDCMDSIHIMEMKYSSGYEDGTNDTKQSVEEWYDPTP